MRPKTRIRLMMAGAVLLATLVGCNMFPSSEGSVQFSITDAPTDAENVKSVFISVSSIEYNLASSDGWEQAVGFADPKQYDLLTLQGGDSEVMADFTLPAGRINQIRLHLDAPVQGSAPGNPGCYVKFTDGTTEPLFIPSGGNTGVKLVGSFEVPVNGEVSVTADFDVRKSVVTPPDGTYILKPAIRLVVDDQAGKIVATVSQTAGAGNSWQVYAYEDGAYDSSEATPNDDGVAFADAVAGSAYDADADKYVLAFLAAGTYDLVLAEIDANGALIGTPELIDADAVVEAGKATNVTIQ